MFRTLRNKLLFFFLIISLGGITFLSLAIDFGFNNSLNHYLDAGRNEKINHIIELVQTEYQDVGTLSGEQMDIVLHQQAMSDHLYYQLYNHNLELIVDSTVMMRMMHGMSRMAQKEIFTQSFPLQAKGEQFGVLKVYYPKGFLEKEFLFLKQFNRYVIGSALLMIIGSIILSMLFAKQLTRGLDRLKAATKELEKGNLSIQISDEKQSKEIKELVVSFNELATSLYKQEKLRKQFTRDLAHELRTPLATLQSQIEAFQDGVWEPSAERLKQSHRELMRLVRLVDEMEKLLSAENPSMVLRKEKLEIGELLQSLYEQFYPAFQDKGIRLTLDDLKEKIWLEVDRDRFMQIMTNIINNALKFTASGGEVRLLAVKEDHKVTMVIEDNGMGISEDDLPHIFERLYRGDKSRERERGGYGIGLSIVKALVEAHKGEVRVESKLGEGTCVIITFPS